MEGQVKMLLVLFLALYACMVGWGAGYILQKQTKYGHISRRNVYLKDVRSILPQIFGRVRYEKGYACLRIFVIALVTFILASAFQLRLNAQTYAMLSCATIVITLFSYDLRLSFLYGVMSSIIGMRFLLWDRFSEENILQTVMAMFTVRAEQALTIILGCATIGIVVLLFSVIYRIWYKEGGEALGGEVNNICAVEDSSQEEFLCSICTIAAYAGIPISCLTSGILVKILQKL